MTSVSRFRRCRRQVACALFLVSCSLFGVPGFSSATIMTLGTPLAEAGPRRIVLPIRSFLCSQLTPRGHPTLRGVLCLE
jgi:hypothetical protein